MEPHDPLALANRSGLPDALRILLAELPRTDWETHANYSGLVQFWLDRHLMFRRLVATMLAETAALSDLSMDPENYAHHLSRYGGFFINELHTHHHVEDTQFFPELVKPEARLARGFEILDSDHHAIDEHLALFAEKANALLKALAGDTYRDQAGAFHQQLETTGRLLDRHLTDEEELVVPVILKHGFEKAGY